MDYSVTESFSPRQTVNRTASIGGQALGSWTTSATIHPQILRKTQNYLMPAEYGGDALHLAYASYYKVDFLMTWNCDHLANANKRQHIRVINGRLGLHVPEIVTPMELVTEKGGRK